MCKRLHFSISQQIPQTSWNSNDHYNVHRTHYSPCPLPDEISPVLRWSTAFPEELTEPQLVKKFSALWRNRNIIAMFTTVHNPSNKASPRHNIPSYFIKKRFNIKLLSMLWSSTRSFSHRFHQQTLYVLFSSPIRPTCPARFIFLDSVTL
jgi:hypothetical protein